jgi:hypothetical protein
MIDVPVSGVTMLHVEAMPTSGLFEIVMGNTRRHAAWLD